MASPNSTPVQLVWMVRQRAGDSVRVFGFAKFTCTDRDALEEITEEALKLMKIALKDRGLLLKNYSREDIVAKAKSGLRKSRRAVELINRIMEIRREPIDFDL